MTAKDRHVEKCDLVIVGSVNRAMLAGLEQLSIVVIDPQLASVVGASSLAERKFGMIADAIRQTQALSKLGVDATVAQLNWSKIRDRVFAGFEDRDSFVKAELQGLAHVEVIHEPVCFIGPQTLRVGQRTINAQQIVLSCGSRPVDPEVPGADVVASRLLTPTSVLKLDKLPRSLLILGDDQAAVEFAHIFATFGVDVTMLAPAARLLPWADREISARLTADLSQRVGIRLRQHLESFESTPKNIVVVTTDEDGVEYEFVAELAVYSMGRIPNADLLDCAAAGIHTDPDGFITVDDHLRTTQDSVWAIGDITSLNQPQQLCETQCATLAHNILHPDRPWPANRRITPTVVYSEPQIAYVGESEESACTAGIDITIGVIDEEDRMIKVIADAATSQLIGAHIIGHDAALLIQPLVLAIHTRIDVRELCRLPWVHPGPTGLVEKSLRQLLA